MWDASQHSNIQFTRVASQNEAGNLRSSKAEFVECVVSTSEKQDRRLFEFSKTNVIISTVGMTSKSHNYKGLVELAISCESFDVVLQDEKQNENGENLLVIPCFLKPSIGLLVLSDDGEQTPPYLPGVLRQSKSKPGLPEPVQTMNLQDLHMSIATSAYRSLMQRPVPIQTWLSALFNLLKKRGRLVEELTLQNFKPCADDEADVTIVTLPNLDGLLSQAGATCMKRCALPGLLFIACCRLPPTMALFTGIQYYSSAFWVNTKPSETRTTSIH